ncbi:MAG: TonB-dependent receptor [Burkholderiales bacterium]
MIALSVCLAPEGFAADPPTVETDAVVVTATRTERALEDVPASVSVVPAHQLQETPAQSLDDALRTVPGLNLPLVSSYATHPTANSISLRGLSGTRALVLLDGVPLNDPFFGYVQWNRVPHELVERVEVVRGGGSNLFGTYALGGVVNIITRLPEQRQLSADLGYGTDDTFRINGFAGGKPADGFKGAINGNIFDTDGFNAVPEAERRPLDIATRFDSKNLHAKGEFQFSPELTGFLRGNVHENEQNLGTPQSRNEQTTWDIATGIVAGLAGVSELRATVFYLENDFTTDNTNTPFGVSPGFAEFVQNSHRTEAEDFGMSVEYSTFVSEQFPLLSFGADYRLIDGQDVARIFDESGAQIRTDIGRGKQRSMGAFAQLSWFPLDALEVLASARYDYFRNFDGFDGNPGGLGNTPDQSETSFNPRLSVRYRFENGFALRAAAYKAFRAPNLDNLYRGFSTPSGIFLPNAELDPETLTGGEAGVDYFGERLRAQFTVFQSDIEDLLDSRNLAFSELPAGFFFGTKNINVGEARSRGVEAEANWKLGEAWSAFANYTYTESKVRDNPLDPTVVGKQIGGVPKNQAAFGLAYRDRDAWSVALRGRWLERHFADTAQTREIDEHFVLDASVNRAFTRYAQLFLNVENLLDEEYIASDSGFSPRQLGTPRRLFGGVRLTWN